MYEEGRVHVTGDRKRVKVVINGKEYTIIGTKSAAHIKLVEKTVNDQLADLDAMSNNLSREEQAILMAVNAVSDQIESHQQMIQLEDKIKNNKTD